MAEDEHDDDARRSEEEVARYRVAAEETLDQLEWCVQYLYRIRKPRIAEVINENRRQIRRQMSPTSG